MDKTAQLRRDEAQAQSFVDRMRQVYELVPPIRQKSPTQPPLLQRGSLPRPVLCIESI